MSAERMSTIDDLDLIIDADSHLIETPEDVAPYIEDPGVRELAELTPRPMSEFFSVAHPTPAAPHTKYTEEGKDTFGGGDVGPEGKREQLAEHGIDYAVIDPGLSLTINTINNSRFATAWANAYNSYALDLYGDDDQFKINMVIAPQKPDHAAEEIDDRGSEESVVGVLLSPAGLVPPAGHWMYEPIYEAAEAHDLPIIFHANMGCNHLNFPVQHRWDETYGGEHVFVHPSMHLWNLTSLLFEAVPERFPDLSFIFAEGGIGWVPYATFRLDDHYMEYAHEIPGLEKLPSGYIEEQFYFTTQPLGLTAKDDKHIAQFIEMIGPDRILYSADLPHPDFDPPSELFNRIRGHFDADTVRDIMARNADAAYGLGYL